MRLIINLLTNKNSVDIDQKRRFFMKKSALVLGGLGGLCVFIPFLSSWMPSAKALEAGKPVEVDLSRMEPGQQITVEWRGKPVWIIRRTSAMLADLDAHSEQLRDPDSHVEQQPDYAKNAFRSINPESVSYTHLTLPTN